MKPFAPGDQLTLRDATGTVLGAVAVEVVEDGLVLGTFRPTSGFAASAELFERFEEHVEAAALAVLPEIEREVAALGLRVGRTDEPPVRIDAVQIYSDGGFSCRPVVPVDNDGAHRPTATV